MVWPRLNLGPTLKTLNLSILWFFERLGSKNHEDKSYHQEQVSLVEIL